MKEWLVRSIFPYTIAMFMAFGFGSLARAPIKVIIFACSLCSLFIWILVTFMISEYFHSRQTNMNDSPAIDTKQYWKERALIAETGLKIIYLRRKSAVIALISIVFIILGSYLRLGILSAVLCFAISIVMFHLYLKQEYKPDKTVFVAQGRIAFTKDQWMRRALHAEEMNLHIKNTITG